MTELCLAKQDLREHPTNHFIAYRNFLEKGMVLVTESR